MECQSTGRICEKQYSNNKSHKRNGFQNDSPSVKAYPKNHQGDKTGKNACRQNACVFYCADTVTESGHMKEKQAGQAEKAIGDMAGDAHLDVPVPDDDVVVEKGVVIRPICSRAFFFKGTEGRFGGVISVPGAFLKLS